MSEIAPVGLSSLLRRVHAIATGIRWNQGDIFRAPSSIYSRSMASPHGFSFCAPESTVVKLPSEKKPLALALTSLCTLRYLPYLKVACSRNTLPGRRCANCIRRYTDIVGMLGVSRKSGRTRGLCLSLLFSLYGQLQDRLIGGHQLRTPFRFYRSA